MELRKVKFKLEHIPESMLEESTGPEQEAARERNGLFHRWSDTLHFSNDPDDKTLARTMGIVESVEDGKIYHVHPPFIQFVKDFPKTYGKVEKD